MADAYAGLRFLLTRPEIDPERVALIGFSYGAMATMYALSANVAALMAPAGERFAAHAAFYGPCIAEFADPRTTGAPLLMLYGTGDALIDPARCDDGEWRVAQLIRFAWTPAPHVASYVAEKAAAAGVPPRDESGAPLPYVALHVRRGDACRCFGGCCWGNADGGGRHCFALEEYIELGATLATALNARAASSEASRSSRRWRASSR